MIKPYESGDMIVVDNNQQVWLVCNRIDEQTYLVQGRNGNRIRLHTDKNRSRLARQDERKAGKKIDLPDMPVVAEVAKTEQADEPAVIPADAVCDHCGFAGDRESLLTDKFDKRRPLTCPTCNGRCFNGGDWLYKSRTAAKKRATDDFYRKYEAMYRQTEKTAKNANGEVL